MTGTRVCSQCAKRRKAMEARKALLKNRGKKVQAATLGAVLAVTDAAAKLLPGKVDSREFAETAGNSIADQIDAQLLRHVTGEEGENERIVPERDGRSDQEPDPDSRWLS